MPAVYIIYHLLLTGSLIQWYREAVSDGTKLQSQAALFLLTGHTESHRFYEMCMTIIKICYLSYVLHSLSFSVTYLVMSECSFFKNLCNARTVYQFPTLHKFGYFIFTSDVCAHRQRPICSPQQSIDWWLALQVCIVFDKCLVTSSVVKHTIGHMIGMIGAIGVKQKRNTLNGCWAYCVKSTFHFTHDIDLGFFSRSKVELAISQEREGRLT